MSDVLIRVNGSPINLLLYVLYQIWFYDKSDDTNSGPDEITRKWYFSFVSGRPQSEIAFINNVLLAEGALIYGWALNNLKAIVDKGGEQKQWLEAVIKIYSQTFQEVEHPKRQGRADKRTQLKLLED